MIVRWFYGELVVLDLSETGTQLGEKLSLLLDDKQQKELAHYTGWWKYYFFDRGKAQWIFRTWML